MHGAGEIPKATERFLIVAGQAAAKRNQLWQRRKTCGHLKLQFKRLIRSGCFQGYQQHGFLQLCGLLGLQLHPLCLWQLALSRKRYALRLQRYLRRRQHCALYVKRRKLHLQFGEPAFERGAWCLHCRALRQQYRTLRIERRLQRCKLFLRCRIRSARQLLQIDAGSCQLCALRVCKTGTGKIPHHVVCQCVGQQSGPGRTAVAGCHGEDHIVRRGNLHLRPNISSR